MPIDAGHALAMRDREVISAERASDLARALFDVQGRAERLDGEYDDNFRITGRDRSWVLKISHAGEDLGIIEAQHAAIRRGGFGEPRLVTADVQGERRHVRLLDWIAGELLSRVSPQSAGLLRSLGVALAKLDRALLEFDHSAAHRHMQWDLLQVAELLGETHFISDARRRALVGRLLKRLDAEVLPVASRLRRSVIHGDANDFNVVVSDDRVVGLIDFGDMVHTATVTDLAIAAAYVMTGKHDPLGAAAHVVAGYESEFSLDDAEKRVLYPLILVRLCMSVVISAARRAAAPEVAYYRVHEAPAWAVLEQLAEVPFEIARDVIFSSCHPEQREGSARESALRQSRRERLGHNLSLSYTKPIHITRGWKQYLYDVDGREYLDAYNNVAHVGHSHPRVVEAVARQMAVLNTNTRYLHEGILEYADRLTSTLPEPLRVCWFVNSGSEANELALRLARAHTGRAGVIVTEGAYHGNTQRLIEVSPYKFNGPGGLGPGQDVRVVAIPDDYRGEFKRGDPNAGEKYASRIADVARAGDAGALLLESLPSVAGQIVPPPGYFAAAFKAVRAAGGVCIVDEVQVGFGRTGDQFWGFERQGVVPDIVVMGKPMGNGHPIGAVVTTKEIAKSFANGMEFFSTFGGNPVSMAAGKAVLDVLAGENLQENARHVGGAMIEMLRNLMTKHAIIGDVRGAGLFIGVELVRDRESLEPATQETSRAVEALRDRGFLTGTEGPFHNVIKIRPPMCVAMEDAERLVAALDAILGER